MSSPGGQPVLPSAVSAQPVCNDENVLVTGGAGSVSHMLLPQLPMAGDDVTVYDRCSAVAARPTTETCG